jgi:ApaG protein
MPEARLDGAAPLSDALTEGVRVEVIARYSPEGTKQFGSDWVFEYTVRITNLGIEPVQLLSRHWRITDALDNTREVKGPGVVGKQPLLAPGESFKYSSWCPLQTPTGVMHGTYQMVRPQTGEQFEVQIAPFALRASYTVH